VKAGADLSARNNEGERKTTFYFISYLTQTSLVPTRRRKIRLIGSNAKCHYLDELTSEETLRQVFYLSEALFPPMTPYSIPLTHCIRVYKYTYSDREGGGEGS
jgi:hypothetical protein